MHIQAEEMQQQDSVLTTAQVVSTGHVPQRANGISVGGAGSPTLGTGIHDNEREHAKGINIPQDVNAHHLSAALHTGVTGSLEEVGCSLALTSL